VPDHLKGSASEHFGRVVRSRRLELAMTVRDLAKEAGISPNTLVLIEKNATSTQLDTISKLASALKTDPRSFFSDNYFPPPTDARLSQLRRCVAENVRTIRNGRGLTQRALEFGASLPDRYVAKIETSYPSMTLAVIERIAQRLSIPLEQLFQDNETNSP
jgi:transcriptional regulator with XRE-family HTH domain